ncbi:hypothetical protein FORC090_1320 [Staphylococcus aureus]|nr:hypothetical protein FORC090_1320 [Staphylococcus aureus]
MAFLLLHNYTDFIKLIKLCLFDLTINKNHMVNGYYND